MVIFLPLFYFTYIISPFFPPVSGSNYPSGLHKGEGIFASKSVLSQIDAIHLKPSSLRQIVGTDGNIIRRKIIRCFGKDKQAHNCRLCVKKCHKSQGISSSSKKTLTNTMLPKDNSGVLHQTIRMCFSSACFNCLNSCRESFGRVFYIERKVSGSVCGRWLKTEWKHG